MRDSGPSYPFYCMTTVFLTSLSFPVFMRCLEIVVHMRMKFNISFKLLIMIEINVCRGRCLWSIQLTITCTFAFLCGNTKVCP